MALGVSGERQHWTGCDQGCCQRLHMAFLVELGRGLGATHHFDLLNPDI